MNKYFKNKSILITGGTGSLGKAIIRYFISNNIKLNRLIIYSRDEQKHFQLEKLFPEKTHKFMRYFIGDVRDKNRLDRAMIGVDMVIHAAAMKHVHIAEYNPDECIKTNVNGAMNVVESCLKNKVKNIVALSTDKACAPINLYGATKLTSDKLFVAANNFKGDKDTKFSVVRYGNVMGSNGSVIPFFLKKKSLNELLPITHPDMTRFNISIEDGVKMIIFALKYSMGGEIFVPKIPSYKVTDLAQAISPKSNTKIIGIRPGEKIHEEMITVSDSKNTYEIGNYYAIIPTNPVFDFNEFVKFHSAKKVNDNFSYNSGSNSNFLSINQLSKLIKNLKI